MSTSSPYQWFYGSGREASELFSRRRLRSFLISVVPLALVLASPPVSAATGIPPLSSLLLVGAYTLVYAIPCLLEGHLQPRVWLVAAAVLHLTGDAVCIGFVVAAGDPATPLWSLAVIYAAMNGAAPDAPPMRLILALKLVSPLAALPFFAADPSTPWAFGGPILISVVAGVGYHFIALRTAQWKQDRRLKDEALAQLRERERELAQVRLARDLHDSVGSALGFVALNAELMRRHAHDPARMQELAQVIDGAARGGLGELRGVLEALTPEAENVDGLAKALKELSTRAGVDVEVRLDGDGALMLSPESRLTLVRVFQECLHNALNRGRAEHVEATLSSTPGRVTLEVVDDGVGFVPEDAPSGRGRANLVARAAELGGAVHWDSGPGRGTRVTFELPVAGAT